MELQSWLLVKTFKFLFLNHSVQVTLLFWVQPSSPNMWILCDKDGMGSGRNLTVTNYLGSLGSKPGPATWKL